jgi:ABC-type nitrate/sulfonate/bicarbonate transport system ATPase subunit
VAAEVRIERLVVSLRRDGSPPVRAIDGIDFELQAASICSIVGRSGCGKTTLLNAIAGVLDRDEASVEGSIQVLPATPVEHRGGPAIGMVFQRPFLFPWSTALENVALYRRVQGGASPSEWRARAEELLSRVGLQGHGDKYPHQLSGGMQQRVALTREFARPLDVLLLDEPFASLDRVTRDQLNECLLMFWTDFKPTIVIVTHDPEEAVLLGDSVMVLDQGRLVKQLDVSSKVPRVRDKAVRISSAFRELVECVLETLHGNP